jgi:hypothetical protein
MAASTFFSFPNPVNNNAARLVAAGVIAMSAIAIGTQELWISAVIAYGFIARVAAGPRLSPLGRAATLIAPHLGPPRPLPGPPKRFAQSMGAAFSLIALGFYLAGNDAGATVVLAILLVPATLEGVFGFCVGCEMFQIGMRLGLVPESVCEECADIYGPAARAARARRAAGAT